MPIRSFFAVEIAHQTRSRTFTQGCRRCGGRLRVIASIEDPVVIERILDHLGRDAESIDPARSE